MFRGVAAQFAFVALSAAAGTPELDNAIGAHTRNGTQPETVPHYRWSKAELNDDGESDAVALLVDYRSPQERTRDSGRRTVRAP